ncbi:MAG TPA: hypothetical protein ENJ84_12985 [Gammaproteobacteria bacterium]|nr:hypothetical protein [Gammaproteobacteria bacterium]
MPYFVYKITPGPTDIVKNLELLQQFEAYREAKVYTKETRKAQGISYADKSAVTTEIKMILAENALEAEEKLMEKREKPILMEWEK